MKKILIRVGIGVVVLLIAIIVVGILSLNGIIKRGIESIGPKLTKVDVKVDSVRLSLFSGSGTIKGLMVGSPAGFKAPQTIRVGSATLTLKPSSILSDKIIINKIEIIEPDITFELGLGGNNLHRILANVEEATGGGAAPAATPAPKPADTAPGKKLQVDDFLIKAAKLRLDVTQFGGKAREATLDDIHLTDLGAGPEGITSAELLKQVLPILEREALKAANAAFPELQKNLNDLTKSLEKSTGVNSSNLNRSIGDLLKKK